MAKQTINLGTTPNDGTGTPLRDAFDMVNDNFDEVYGEDFVTNARLANITRGSIKVGGASNAPTDLDASGNAKILIGDGTDLNSVTVSGDITIDNTGNVTISDTAVENIMLGDDAVGADELADNAVATASIQDDAVTPAKINILDDSLAATNAHIMVGDGTDFSNVAVSGDINIDNTGATTIQTGAIETAMINANIITGQTQNTDFVAGTDQFLSYDASASALRFNYWSTIQSTIFHELGGDGMDVASDGTVSLDVDYGSLDAEYTNIQNDQPLSSGSATATCDAAHDAIFPIQLPGDGTNVTIKTANFKQGQTKLIQIETNASTAHTGTITFAQNGSLGVGTGTYTRVSPQDIDQSANKTNFVFMTCIDSGGNSKLSRSSTFEQENKKFIYSVAVAQ